MVSFPSENQVVAHLVSVELLHRRQVDPAVVAATAGRSPRWRRCCWRRARRQGFRRCALPLGIAPGSGAGEPGCHAGPPQHKPHWASSATHELAGASPFPRHWIYDDDGNLVVKSGTIDFEQWYRESHGKHTPWGDEDSEALTTAVESELGR